TTFVDSTELQAILPQAQVAVARTTSIVVDTPGAGQSTLPFVINPAPTNPLIEGQAVTGSFPSGVAVDSKRNHVLVTNQASDSVSVIDLTTRTAVKEIKVGRSPADGIAIYGDMALVANPGSNNVSVIDLVALTETKKIDVGTFPIGVAVDATAK